MQEEQKVNKIWRPIDIISPQKKQERNRNQSFCNCYFLGVHQTNCRYRCGCAVDFRQYGQFGPLFNRQYESYGSFGHFGHLRQPLKPIVALNHLVNNGDKDLKAENEKNQDCDDNNLSSPNSLIIDLTDQEEPNNQIQDHLPQEKITEDTEDTDNSNTSEDSSSEQPKTYKPEFQIQTHLKVRELSQIQEQLNSYYPKITQNIKQNHETRKILSNIQKFIPNDKSHDVKINQNNLPNSTIPNQLKLQTNQNKLPDLNQVEIDDSLYQEKAERVVQHYIHHAKLTNSNTYTSSESSVSSVSSLSSEESIPILNKKHSLFDHMYPKRRRRTNFTSDQLKVLNTAFAKNAYLDGNTLADLANKLSLEINIVKTWYQNQRQKGSRRSLKYKKNKIIQEKLVDKAYVLHDGRYVLAKNIM